MGKDAKPTPSTGKQGLTATPRKPSRQDPKRAPRRRRTPPRSHGLKRPLTMKAQAFIREYLVDRNATQAAIRAGFSKASAYSIGYELLRKHEIEKAIAAMEEQLAKCAAMKREEAVALLAEMARGRLQDFVDEGGGITIHHKPNPRAVQEFHQEETHTDTDRGPRVTVKRRVKLADRIQAIGTLAKILGWEKAPAANPEDPLMSLIRAIDGKTKGIPVPAAGGKDGSP